MKTQSVERTAEGFSRRDSTVRFTDSGLTATNPSTEVLGYSQSSTPRTAAALGSRDVFQQVCRKIDFFDASFEKRKPVRSISSQLRLAAKSVTARWTAWSLVNLNATVFNSDSCFLLVSIG